MIIPLPANFNFSIRGDFKVLAAIVAFCFGTARVVDPTVLPFPAMRAIYRLGTNEYRCRF
jgi:hypothetical protein